MSITAAISPGEARVSRRSILFTSADYIGFTEHLVPIW